MPTYTVITRDNTKHTFEATTVQGLKDHVAMKLKRPETDFSLVEKGNNTYLLTMKQQRKKEPSALERELREAVHSPARVERLLKKHDFEGVFPEPKLFKGSKGQVGMLETGPLSGGSKVFAGASKKRDAEKALQKRPVLVLFFMTGCPHCEANKPAWDEAKAKAPSGTEVVEVESSAVPDSEAVSGFPTMKLKKNDGTESVISGQKGSGAEILSELGVKQGGSYRRRSFRRSHSRRNRKLRHRTLRNHVAF